MSGERAVSLWYARMVGALRERRQELRMSIYTTAGQVGVNWRSIVAWEHLEYTPTVAHLIRWHQVLDMRLVSSPMESKARQRFRPPRSVLRA